MLFDQSGNRKYLTRAERNAFILAAKQANPSVETFCLTLALSGGRISEVLALTPRSIDQAAYAVVIESLKKRRSGVYRAIPVPETLFLRLEEVHGLAEKQSDAAFRDVRIWPWSRITAWKHVRSVMEAAGISVERGKPKALRHAFGVAAVQAGIPITIIQKWLGHARLETTAIYTTPTGDEERGLASRMWKDVI